MSVVGGVSSSSPRSSISSSGGLALPPSPAPPPAEPFLPHLTPGTSPSNPHRRDTLLLELNDDAYLRPPPAAYSTATDPGRRRRSSAKRRRSKSAEPMPESDERYINTCGIPVPFLFPLPLCGANKQDQEEQAARVLEYTQDLNAQIVAFKELMWWIGGAKDSQQIREDLRKCRMAAMDLCRAAKPLIIASHKWQQPTSWSFTMTPAAMWYELLKMFQRQLHVCHILVKRFPADMTGYDGGALSKLLVQSLRPEWNKQEEASVQMAILELGELISSTGVETPDAEVKLESSSVLERPQPPRRRSTLSFMLCCSGEETQTPSPVESATPRPLQLLEADLQAVTLSTEEAGQRFDPVAPWDAV